MELHVGAYNPDNITRLHMTLPRLTPSFSTYRFVGTVLPNGSLLFMLGYFSVQPLYMHTSALIFPYSLDLANDLHRLVYARLRFHLVF